MLSRRSPDIARRPASIRPVHFMPLVGFVVPSVVIGYGFVLPGAGLGGVNALSVGFATTLLGAVATYIVGIVLVARR